MPTLQSGLPDVVGDNEDLARFLTSSSHFNAVMVKPSAFMPSNGETSVYRHGEHPRDRLWQIAFDNGVVPVGRTLYGAAMLKAARVIESGLDVSASEPPLRHANIVGWPTSETDPLVGKAQQKEKALLIAQASIFLRC